MGTRKARRLHPDGHTDGVIYRQQYVRCGKPACRTCPPHGPGHGPYWYGFYWDYRQRTTSFYVGKTLPAGVELVHDVPPQVPRESRGASPAAGLTIPAAPSAPGAPTPMEGGDVPDLP